MAQQCKRCSVCEGLEHHWLEGFAENEDGEIIHPYEPILVCKHCQATKPYDGEEDYDGLTDDEEDDDDPASVLEGILH